VNDVGVPIFYIYRSGNGLWIVNRDSNSTEDFKTDFDFIESDTSLGTFHSGMLTAANYTFRHVYEYIANHRGPIYFTGHSYGAAVGPILLVLAHNAFPAMDFNAIGFASLPMMDDDTAANYKGKIVTIVNRRDFVPTFSFPNLHAALEGSRERLDDSSMPELAR
jgi:hypothetical protein